MARTHAVVIGGSFSGLAAGRARSEFFDRGCGDVGDDAARMLLRNW